MGVKNDVANYFRTSFEEANVMNRVVMLLNLSNDPIDRENYDSALRSYQQQKYIITLESHTCNFDRYDVICQEALG